MSLFGGFPPVPDRLSFKIGEVGRLVGAKPHVLRYWEQEFGRVRPKKSANGHRLYSRADIDRLRRIKLLLHDRGFTIAGARALLQQGDDAVDAVLLATPQAIVDEAPNEDASRAVEALQSAIRASEQALGKARAEALFWREAAQRAEARLLRVRAAVAAHLGDDIPTK